MEQEIVGNKRYAPSEVVYDIIGSTETLALEVRIEEIDAQEFVIRAYTYGLSLTPEELEVFMCHVQPMKDYEVERIVELGA